MIMLVTGYEHEFLTEETFYCFPTYLIRSMGRSIGGSEVVGASTLKKAFTAGLFAFSVQLIQSE
jgi:hypothetical protein